MASVTMSRRREGILRRPTAMTGFSSWFTTIDHKKIGILYGVTAFVFFVVGGVEALLIRAQLAQPDGTLLNADQYNQVFTMHGITMIFLFVMPMAAAFFNYFIPLMIGARDVAFPRLNAYSYWVFLLGGLFLYSSFFLGGAPNGGWFGYAPNSTTDPTIGMSFYAIGLIITGIASTAGAVNLAVTVINLRAPGMSLFRVPVFVWMGLVVQLLLAFSLPIITVALFQLLFDRELGTHFFDPTAGADPILWQHLFWLFGHPEVYVLIPPRLRHLLGGPAGLLAEAPVRVSVRGVLRDRDRLHRVRRVGPPHVRGRAGAGGQHRLRRHDGDHRGAHRRQDLQLDGHHLRGDIRFTSSMLFTLGGIMMFVIGGLSGVTHAIVPSDYQQTDTYYIVAHFHYVIFGGGVFAFFSAMFYWWPKVFGRLLNERLGVIEFVLTMNGFNLTFGPMHILGLQGMIRRTYTYPESLGLTFWNQAATVGAFLIALSVLLFIINVVISHAKAKPSDVADPWDARTLEWMTTSPPPVHNFDEVPTVHARDEFWHRKYVEDERTGRLVPAQAGAANGHRRRARGSRHPPAQPLVLAARGGARHAGDRVRRALLLVARRGRVRDRADRLLRMGDGAVGVAGGRVAMADVALAHGSDHPETTTGLPHTKLAMWIFLASECMLFGALITTYVLYRGRPGQPPPHPSEIFDIPYTSVSSFVLLTSSLTMVLALSAAQDRDTGRMRLWLLTTALLGLTFVGGQVYEFTAFYNEGLKLSTNLFGTTFYVLTGFHGVHVTVGVLMLLSLVGLSSAERLPEDPPSRSRWSGCIGTSSTSCGS